MSSKIYGIYAREILDSRGNPTVETTVVLESGYRGIASVPSGASLGKYEAVELRDGDPKRFNGLGVLKAVSNVTDSISPKLVGFDVCDQKRIDETMIALDATPDKHALGANSILSVSLACANAAAAYKQQPLYRYVNTLFQQYMPVQITRIPTPSMNIINGGKHGAGNLNFQEFHVIPATNKSYHDALRMGVEIYQALKKILIYRNAVHSVGDEGGFAPNLFTNMEALDLLSEAIRSTPYKYSVEVFFGLDIAATQFKTDKGYLIKDKETAMNGTEFMKFLIDIHKKYGLLILEDPFGEDEWDSWISITAEIGKEVLIVGDDLIATNEERLKRAISEKACSAVLLKPNQIGTLTEFLRVVHLAKSNHIHCIVSHRSGETNDSSVADLAVAVQSDYVKFGAPDRGERVSKYNRLLQIEQEIIHT